MGLLEWSTRAAVVCFFRFMLEDKHRVCCSSRVFKHLPFCHSNHSKYMNILCTKQNCYDIIYQEHLEEEVPCAQRYRLTKPVSRFVSRSTGRSTSRVINHGHTLNHGQTHQLVHNPVRKPAPPHIWTSTKRHCWDPRVSAMRTLLMHRLL